VARRHLEKVLPYTPEQLFELVGDVRRYPEFVPWITSMRVWNERAESGEVSTLDAEAIVGFTFLREAFATRVRRDRSGAAPVIQVSLLHGPFRKLANRWVFEPHPVGTHLKFDIEFEFKSRLFDAILAANSDTAVNKLIACFESRAMALYAPLTGARPQAVAASARA
jgi:coenzyme Q-binding protein COQ10